VYRRELAYYHVRNVVKTLEFLEREHPRYIWTDPTQDLKFSFVPQAAIARYYAPERRLVEVVRAPADSLETEVAGLVEALRGIAGLDIDDLGITGSILLSLHDPSFSDIDLLVYGGRQARRLRDALAHSPASPLSDLEPERRARWRHDIAERFGLSAEAVADLETRRWNHRLFRGRYVSLHPTRRDDEIRDGQGRRSRRIGPAAIEAVVVAADESVFLPAVYRLADVRFEDGATVPALELLSYEGLFCDVADPGDRIRARGVLEELEGGALRLVVGTAAVADGGALWRVRPDAT
jgi:predicted nucleotidyltransferase